MERREVGGGGFFLRGLRGRLTMMANWLLAGWRCFGSRGQLVRGVTTGGERFSRSSIIFNCSTHVISWFKNNFFYEHKYTSIHHYECMYTHCTLMNIFERLRRLDL
jgi:hypothetical protein